MFFRSFVPFSGQNHEPVFQYPLYTPFISFHFLEFTGFSCDFICIHPSSSVQNCHIPSLCILQKPIPGIPEISSIILLSNSGDIRNIRNILLSRNPGPILQVYSLYVFFCEYHCILNTRKHEIQHLRTNVYSFSIPLSSWEKVTQCSCLPQRGDRGASWAPPPTIQTTFRKSICRGWRPRHPFSPVFVNRDC